MSRRNPRFRRANLPLPPIVNNIYLATLQGIIEGQNTINTLYYADNKPLGSPTANAEGELAQALTVGLGPTLQGCTSAEFQFLGTKVTCLNVPTRATSFSSPASPTFGTGGAGHEPTIVAAQLIRLTAYKGQSGRGRIGVPAVPAPFVFQSSLTAAAQTAYGLFESQLLLALTTAFNVFTPGLVSRRLTGTTILYGFGPLVRWKTDVVLGTIRRRKLGRGK